MRALPMKNLNSAKLGIATGTIVSRSFFLLLPAGHTPLEFRGMREQIARFCLGNARIRFSRDEEGGHTVVSSRACPMHANVKTILGADKIVQSCRQQVLMRLIGLGDSCDF